MVEAGRILRCMVEKAHIVKKGLLKVALVRVQRAELERKPPYS